MTTIVADFRRKIMVADNQATTNAGEMKIPCKKLYRITKGKHKGHIIGTSGHEGPCMMFIDIYTRALIPRSGFDRPAHVLSIDEAAEGFECVILRPDGIFVADRFLIPYKLDVSYYATGSGAQFAIGAMDAGAKAEDAVHIACRRDPSSSPMGRGLQTMRLKP